MLAPLVLPEVLRGAAVRQPVSVHELQEVGLPGVLEDLGDAAVGRGEVAELWVRAVAEVGPAVRG